MIFTRVLVLDQSYLPHRIVSWQRAVCLLFDGKAEIVEEGTGTLRSPSMEMAMPSVVRLVGRARGARRVTLRFSRVNVMTRDGFRCQYCAIRLPMRQLNYDHVLPRSRGGKTTWENVVTACYPCNSKKGDRTPAEAGMTLLKTPVKPAWLPVTSHRWVPERIPRKWYPYLGLTPPANDDAAVA